MIITIIIPEVPISLNKLLRMHWSQRSKYQLAWDYAVLSAIQQYPKLKNKNLDNIIINITYYFKDNRKRDYDNYSGKMILDALKHNKIIKDDNCLCVTGIGYYIKLNQKENKTEIKIIQQEVKND